MKITSLTHLNLTSKTVSMGEIDGLGIENVKPSKEMLEQIKNHCDLVDIEIKGRVTKEDFGKLLGALYTTQVIANKGE